MSSSVMIGGVNRECNGGLVCVGNVNREIVGGLTCIGNVNRELDIGKVEISDLFSEMILLASNGRSVGNTNYITLDATEYMALGDTAYVIVATSSHLAISKIVLGQSMQLLYHEDMSWSGFSMDANGMLYCYDGLQTSLSSAKTAKRGWTIALVQFNASESQTDKALSALQYVTSKGRASSETGALYIENVSTTISEGDILFACYTNGIGINRYEGDSFTNLFGNYEDNPSLIDFRTSKDTVYLWGDTGSAFEAYAATLCIVRLGEQN